MPCWIQALTPTSSTLSNSMFCTTQNDLEKYNPFHSSITPHLHDHPYQPPSAPLTANSFIGPPPPEDKPNHIFHLLCSNPNGFNLCPQGDNFIDYCKEVYRFQADTSCLYEHNLDSYNHAVKNILYKTTQRAFDHSKLTTASSPIPATSTFKPGGTMTLTQGSCIGRLISSGHDEMGFWSYHMYSYKNFCQLTFASVYKPCNQRVTDSGRVRTLTVTAQHNEPVFSDNKGATRLPGKPLSLISDSSSPTNMVREMAFYLLATVMKNSISRTTESQNCALISTSLTSCFI